ncbi:hypothetical protein RJ639_005228 [Escallonia herrerae]|uniref:Pentatricopeptide repeat-containing protein n=1 Tax=Escallonia herrerae TaxID=1293975 RepID=A0AA88W162_9ASTE|nr:hypothetical protein RJ639_005228 [Escallonia herrerae]
MASNHLRLLSYTKLLTSHVNEGRHDQALYLFRHIFSSLTPDPFIFPLALKAGRLHEAYEVIRKMPLNVTVKAWGALLGACRTYGEVELAEVAGRALFEIEPDNAANYVLLARIYADAGRNEEAERMRREMTERGVKAAPGGSWLT